MVYKVLLVILLQCSFSCKQPEPETYLIPSGFTGKVNIIFNQEKGMAPKYENGRRLYEIPPSGILLTQFKDEYGLVSHQYFYVDSIGKRTTLPILNDTAFADNQPTHDKNEIGVFYDGTTGVYGNSGNTQSLKYQQFFITSFTNL